MCSWVANVVLFPIILIFSFAGSRLTFGMKTSQVNHNWKDKFIIVAENDSGSCKSTRQRTTPETFSSDNNPPVHRCNYLYLVSFRFQAVIKYPSRYIRIISFSFHLNLQSTTYCQRDPCVCIYVYEQSYRNNYYLPKYLYRWWFVSLFFPSSFIFNKNEESKY